LTAEGLSDEFRNIMEASQSGTRGPVLCFTWFGDDWPPTGALHDFFVSTMWETSQLPSGMADRLNQARAVIAPSRFVADVFRASGVTVPIEIVPLGIDPDVYYWEDRPGRLGLTTLIVGIYVPRKHIDEGVAAWKLAFGDDPTAR